MKILIAGDYCPKERVAKKIEEGDYESILGDVKKETDGADYAIVNLECPVVEHEASPIDKCGPNLKCSPKAVEALKWAGFNCVTLANNHFLDFGETGVSDTLRTCRSKGLDVVGGGNNALEASKILFKDIKGKKLAIINCCEHEFSIATDNTAGSNPLNIVQQYYDIQEARKIADYIIVIIHGGVELFWLPSKRMIETYRFFVDAGADAVVNHHQHCYSGYEVYKGKPIFYGLGNFCFDGNPYDYRWTSGFMVNINFADCNIVTFDVLPYRQCDKEVCVRHLNEKEKDEFLGKISDYNRLIKDDIQRELLYLKWCQSKEGMYKSVLNPVSNRYTEWFFKTRIGDRLLTKRKLLQIYDYLVNESHVERIRLLYNSKINKYK